MHTTLILLRHGETLWNRDGRFQGQLDIELNDTGRRQARQAARRLARERIDVIYSSDLRRASETAEIVAQGRGMTPITTPALRERHWGDWQGLYGAEVRDRFPELVRRWAQGDPDMASAGGETIRELCRRVSAWVSEIPAKHPGQTVLAVGHGAALKAMIGGLIGLPMEMLGRFRLDNASVSIIELRDDRPVLALLNDTAHTQVAEDTETDGRPEATSPFPFTGEGQGG